MITAAGLMSALALKALTLGFVPLATALYLTMIVLYVRAMLMP